VGGVVEVDVLVVKAAEEILEGLDLEGEIVASREGAQFLEKVRMAEGDVRGVVGPEREAVGNGTLVAVFQSHQGHDLVEDVVLVLYMPADAVVGTYPAGVEAVFCVAVHAVELELAFADLIREAVVHTEIFILVEVAVAGGEDEHFCPGVSDDEEAHLAFDTVTVPVVVFKVHPSEHRLSSKGKRESLRR